MARQRRGLVVATGVALALLCACEDGEQKCYVIEGCPAFAGAPLQVCCTSAKCVYNVPTDNTAGSTTFECNAVFPGCATAHEDAYAYCGLVVVDAGAAPDGGPAVVPDSGPALVPDAGQPLPAGPAIELMRPTALFATLADVGVSVIGGAIGNGAVLIVHGAEFPLQQITATGFTTVVTGGALQTPGPYELTVRNPGSLPGPATVLTVQAVPFPAPVGADPGQARAGSQELVVTIELTGNTLVPGAYVLSGTSQLLPVLRRDAAHVVVSLPANLLTAMGAQDLFVVNPAPGGDVQGNSAPVYVVDEGNPYPSLETVAGDVVAQGTPATLHVTGTGYADGLTARFLDRGLAVANLTTTDADVPLDDADVVVAGEFRLVLQNPAPGGGTGNGYDISVTGTNVAPELTGSSPTILAGGGATDVDLLLFGAHLGRGTAVTMSRDPSGASPTALGHCRSDGDTGSCGVTVPADLTRVFGPVYFQATNGDVVGSPWAVTVE